MSTTVCSGVTVCGYAYECDEWYSSESDVYRWGVPTYSGTMTGGVSAENVATNDIWYVVESHECTLRTATYEVIPNVWKLVMERCLR
jgi:hypothetical protein